VDTLIIIFGAGSGFLLIALGFLLARRTHDPAPDNPGGLGRVSPIQPLVVSEASPGTGSALIERLQQAVAHHPAPLLGWFETAWWLFMLLTLIDNLAGRTTSRTAQVIWWLTIGPHEIGHLICIPFGWTLQFAGGSIWQILWWALLAIWVMMMRRQISLSLLFWVIAGHSFINLSVYVGDASSRSLPLLFGADSSHHDWWNLLGHYGLLDYDHLLEMLAMGTGAAMVIAAVLMGLLTTWLLPRRQIGPAKRYYGGLFEALRDVLAGPRKVSFDFDDL
jgi:hypothetical protein